MFLTLKGKVFLLLKGAHRSLHLSTIKRALRSSSPSHICCFRLKMKMARLLYRVLSSICLVAFGIALFLQIKELFSFSHRDAFFEQTLNDIKVANERLQQPQRVETQVTIIKLKTLVIYISALAC